MEMKKLTTMSSVSILLLTLGTGADVAAKNEEKAKVILHANSTLSYRYADDSFETFAYASESSAPNSMDGGRLLVGGNNPSRPEALQANEYKALNDRVKTIEVLLGTLMKVTDGATLEDRLRAAIQQVSGEVAALQAKDVSPAIIDLQVRVAVLEAQLDGDTHR